MGVCGNLYSLALGSVDNILRFESDPDALAEAIPEIYALEAVGDHVVLNITDALHLPVPKAANAACFHYSTALNELRFSTDPVALDVLSIQELDTPARGRPRPAGQGRPEDSTPSPPSSTSASPTPKESSSRD